MKIIISPAKRMRTDDYFDSPRNSPAVGADRTAAPVLRGLPYEQFRALLGCNDEIASLNFKRYQSMDLVKISAPHPLLRWDPVQIHGAAGL
jgi:cytoplasmic iron level regulating protein YaaA (DUF328/UPF0246 family)